MNGFVFSKEREGRREMQLTAENQPHKTLIRMKSGEIQQKENAF
jgi:hypothetical protein